MLSALQQQQNSASYNPSPQALYGPVGGAFPHAQGQTPPHLQRHDQAFLGQHVNPAAASANHRSNGDGVRSPSAAVSAGGSVMQSASANANTNSSGGESPFPLLSPTTPLPLAPSLCPCRACLTPAHRTSLTYPNTGLGRHMRAHAAGHSLPALALALTRAYSTPASAQ